MPIQCPNCHCPMEPPGAGGGNCVCPSCGSSIQFDAAVTAIWPGNAPRRRPDHVEIRCPSCSSPLEMDATQPSGRICPSCGSSIQFDPRATTAWLSRKAIRRLGKFELVEQIGAGSYGAVFRARDTELGRMVAIKIPRTGRVAEGEETERFLREARNVAQLRHPGIVVLHDVGQAEGITFLVSEFIQGATLAERQSTGRLSFRKSAELVVQAADALQYAHSKGVIHRDVKPSNIILDQDGNPHVMDFGLAKRAADEITMTQEGQVVGTPAYMSPEQARGEVSKIDARSDLYSLGVVLYEMLTGELPFRGQTRMVLVQVIQDEPRPPRKLNDRIPRDLETICLKAMAKEPHRRYQSAGEMADDVRRHLQGEPILARPMGKMERLWRWSRRYPATATAAGAVAAALVGLALLSFWFAWYEKAAAETLGREKTRTEQALLQAEESLREARRQTGIQMLERGQALCAQQQVPEGLFWFVRSLKEMPEDDPALPHVIRANLGQWLTQVNPLRAMLLHQKQILAVAFSPDGKTVATASEDGTARLWDAATGEPLGAPLSHGGPVRSVAFSPDGLTLLTGGDDQIGRLWEVATGRLMGSPLAHLRRIWTVAFSPDGRTMLTGSADKTVKLWQAGTGKQLGPPLAHEQKVNAAAFSPDSKLVVTAGDDKTARLWETSTGKPLRTWLHDDDVVAVAFSPDGKTVLTGSTDRTARLWDTATGKLLFPPLPHQGAVLAVAFNPGGQTVLTGSQDQAARLWDATTGRSIGFPLQHKGKVGAVAFSPDGKTVLTASDDRTARLWETATGRPVGSPLQHEHWVQAAAFSPDGRTVLTGSVDLTARLWDVATGNTHGTVVRQAGLNAVAVSSDGQLLAIGGEDKTARLCRTTSGLPVGPPLEHRHAVNAVAFSPDGQRILTGAGVIAQLWEVGTGRPVGFSLRHQNLVVCVAFSPDGKTLLTGSDDRTARLWEAATGRELCAPMQHRDRLTSAAFGPDGKTVFTGCWDKTAQMWDAATGRPIGQPLQLPEVVYVVAYSPDGQTLLTGCWDQTVRLWDAATLQPIGMPLRLSRSAWSAAFTPDGKGLLTGGMDFMVRLWDAATGRPIGPPWEHQGGVYGLAAHPDGKSVLTCSDDRTARLWLVRSALPGSPEQLQQALAVLTGMELDSSGVVRWLTADTWERYRRQAREFVDAPWQRERLLPSAVTWHTAQASEAEHQSRPFAAMWHLERLGALEPNAWFWPARRAHLHLLRAQWQQAEAENARARECAAGQEMENWYRHQLADCRLAQRWPAALWYADRLLALTPRDGNVYAARSDILGHLALPIPAAIDLARALKLGAAPAQISFLTRPEAVTKNIGVIVDWLILAPLPLKERQSGVEGLDQDQLSGEAELRPSAADKVRINGTELAWSRHRIPSGFMVDFNVLMGKMQTQSVAYAVCYLVVGENRSGLGLLIGSDDQSKIYLNGKEIYRCAAARAHHEDEDMVENVTLRKGTNVLVFKVVNETAEWRGSIRLVDRSGQPARDIKVSLTPEL